MTQKSKSPKTALAKRNEGSNLTKAFQDLSDGVVTLLRQHLELFREEAKRDAKVFSKQISLITVGGVLLGFGYLLFWGGLAMVAGAVWGLLVGGVVTLGVGALHLLIGASVIRNGLAQMKEQRRDALSAVKNELERSSKWVKQINKGSSSPAV